MNSSEQSYTQAVFTAAILAGERAAPSPVAEAAAVCCKAIAPVAGEPMLQRVVKALAGSEYIDRLSIVGLADEAASVAADVPLLAGKNSPSASVCHVLERYAQQLPVLITTADHALLSTEIVDYFCRKAARSSADLIIALAEIDSDDKRFSGLKRTLYRFHGHAYGGCNLYAFMTPEARAVPQYWLQVEQQRKRVLNLIARIGWRSVLSYLFGRLTLEEALARLSSRFGLRIEALILTFPQAAIDVDSVQDWYFVNRYLGAPVDEG
ncbi:MAG: nucleotidyltransferase family protein [gamma proteobacterium symbiont of Bathyaustriella thionipta]|nr:nucleotidyltransferase family protein [gamma proteobacterium symbiont of Bathyaustriella thionipta]